MNILDDLNLRTARHFEAVCKDIGADASSVKLNSVEFTKDQSHGDVTTNICMMMAKQLSRPPKELAEKLAEKFKAETDIEKVEVAGAGFVNMTFTVKFWQDVLKAIIASGEAYGTIEKQPLQQNTTTNIEYVSANPTGPLHVGHGRGAVFGDALANLVEASGQNVVREYYINDAGAQVDVLARSAFLRYREANGEDIGDIPQGLYPGDYLVDVGVGLKDKFGASLLQKTESEWLAPVRDFSIRAMMQMIRDDLAQIGIVQDVFYSERKLVDDGRVKSAIEHLRQQGVIYEGVLPRPKGAVDDDWEERTQTLFRATDFGDDVDRPLMKSDGSFTYFATDIAYHLKKFEGEGDAPAASHLINVWGADHGGYVKRMQAAVKAMTKGQGVLDVRLAQLVKLMRNGEPVKMSKRSGDFVTLREVIDEVGRDAIRFMMLMRKNDAPLDFDLAKVVEQSKDNPVFYVQYAHARVHSVSKQAAQALPMLEDVQSFESADLGLIADSAEIDLIKKMSFYPRLITSSATAKEPHRLAFYLYDLASTFHSLWNKGKDMPHLRFIKADDEAWTIAHLALLQAFKGVIASGLRILGVSAPQEMR